MAKHFKRSAHVRGDLFRRMIVSGRETPVPPLTPEAETQLALRRHLASAAALAYARSGFTTVIQDLYLGGHLLEVVRRLVEMPLHVIVLNPSPDVVAERERGRSKSGYSQWDVAALWKTFNDVTPRIGRWIDTPGLDVDRTIRAILGDRDGTRVTAGDRAAVGDSDVSVRGAGAPRGVFATAGDPPWAGRSILIRWRGKPGWRWL